MTVSVQLMADLRRYLPSGVDGAFRCTLPPGATVGDLLGALGIPGDADLTVGVDGELAQRESILHDNAEILLVSPMEGGGGSERGAESPSLR